ncbi:MAG: hypothetical protein GX946_10970, partial [Oligosphaeraceae bacterium]|nr:hypothetical protein [Oligosphaeraceae bacterium]
SIYPVVIYDSKKKGMPRIKKKLQKLKIDRYYWYLPGTEYSGQAFVELPAFGRFRSEEDQWILDALNSLTRDVYDFHSKATEEVLSVELGWGMVIHKKLEALKGRGDFYSTDRHKWETEVFNTARIILIGCQSRSVRNAGDYQLLIETSFSKLGEFLAEVFKGKVEDLPGHFFRPTKALRGMRVPKKWYQLPSDKTCQSIQYSNCAGYVALSRAIKEYFKSHGKKVASEDDILYAKRAVMLRLRRLYKKLSKKVREKSQAGTQDLQEIPVSKDSILLPLEKDWKKAMFTPVKDQTGRQRRRKTDSRTK